VKCEYVDSHELIVLETPSFSSEGFKTLQVINPGGTSAVLENVLYYYAPSSAAAVNKQTSSFDGWATSGSTAVGFQRLHQSPSSEGRFPTNASATYDTESNITSNRFPTVESVSPAVSPLQGGMPMRLTGRNLFDGIVVKVGGVLIQDLQFDRNELNSECDLLFSSPRMDSEGFRDMEVFNPKLPAPLNRVVLPNVVYYMQALPSSHPQQARPHDQRSSHTNRSYNTATESNLLKSNNLGRTEAPTNFGSQQTGGEFERRPPRVWGTSQSSS